MAWLVNELLACKLVRELPSEDPLESMVRCLSTLMAKAMDVEQARQKVTSDVEKLIKNQETFEKRVSEMDSVYKMLTIEQKKLRDKKH